MAEGLLRQYGKDDFEVLSAGIESAAINPIAVEVMAEIDIDISQQVSKTLDRYLDQSFDEVITVCDSASKSCPFFPNAKHRRDWDLSDPEKFQGNKEEVLQAFRDSRDAIKAKIEEELLSVSD